MLYIILLVVLAVFYTIGGIVSVKQTKRQFREEITEEARLIQYKIMMSSQWVPVIAIFVIVALTHITLGDIGFRWLTFGAFPPVLTGIVLAAAILYIAYYLLKIIAFCASPKFRQRQHAKLAEKANSDNYYDMVIYKLMTPRTKKEKRWWLPLNMTAGFCEEMMFRGVFVFLITAIFPNMSIYLIIVIAVVLFGVMHVYQGGKGFISTSLGGAYYTIAFVASGSLIIPVIMHFMHNYAMAFMYSDEDAV